jgi:hypothetical protein
LYDRLTQGWAGSLNWEKPSHFGESRLRLREITLAFDHSDRTKFHQEVGYGFRGFVWNGDRKTEPFLRGEEFRVPSSEFTRVQDLKVRGLTFFYGLLNAGY